MLFFSQALFPSLQRGRSLHVFLHFQKGPRCPSLFPFLNRESGFSFFSEGYNLSCFLLLKWGQKWPCCFLIYRDGRILDTFISFPEVGDISLFYFLTERAQFPCFYTFSWGVHIYSVCFQPFRGGGGSSGVFVLSRGGAFSLFSLLYRGEHSLRVVHCYHSQRVRNYPVVFLLYRRARVEVFSLFYSERAQYKDVSPLFSTLTLLSDFSN